MVGKQVKHSMKLSTLLIKARGTEELAAKPVSKREYTALITSLQKELRDLGFKIRYLPPTRTAEGEIALFDNAKWALSLVVYENLSMTPELYDKTKDVLKTGGKKKSLKLCMPDIKAFMKIIAKEIKTKDPTSGMKPVTDKTTRDPKVAKKSGKKVIKVPDFNNSATKARNWIKKTVGGELIKSMASLMGNTAYNNWQTLEIDLTGPQVEALKKIMLDAGIVPVKSQYTKNEIVYKQNDLDIKVNTKMWKPTTGRSKGKVLYQVKCVGSKKAKGTNYFMYD